MARLQSFRSLSMAALLCGIVAGGVAAERPDPSQALPEQTNAAAYGTSDSTAPAPGFTTVATVLELDLRGVRLATVVSPARVQQSRATAPTLCRLRATVNDSAGIAVRARLLHGGIHNSSLGTPPPQS